MKEKLRSHSLIAVSGCKNAGKDSITSMLQYCLSVPKMLRQYWIYKNFRKWISPKYKRLAFADPLKRILAILLNVPVSKFNNRHFKEDCVINIPTLDYSLSAFNEEPDVLSDSKFNKLVKNLDPSLTQSNLTVRQLMQYFGTEICRRFFGKDVWINCTLKHCNVPTIISDCRFWNEYHAIKEHGGIVIYVNRPNLITNSHQSEIECIDMYNNSAFDYVINNNGTLKDLFESVKKCTENLQIS